MLSERTNEMCTPSERWIPEHSRQKYEPYESDAQIGLCAPQSTHFLLPGSAAASSSKNCIASRW